MVSKSEFEVRLKRAFVYGADCVDSGNKHGIDFYTSIRQECPTDTLQHAINVLMDTFPNQIQFAHYFSRKRVPIEEESVEDAIFGDKYQGSLLLSVNREIFVEIYYGSIGIRKETEGSCFFVYVQ